jgi:hypothetical protein
MEMIVRPFTTEDYPVVQHWWHLKTGGCGFPPAELLSSDGLMIDDVCAIWVYLASNAPFAYIAWSVAMPDAAPTRVAKGLEMVLAEAEAVARRAGAKIIMIPHQYKSMHRLLEKCEYLRGEDTTLFLKGI